MRHAPGFPLFSAFLITCAFSAPAFVYAEEPASLPLAEDELLMVRDAMNMVSFYDQDGLVRTLTDTWPVTNWSENWESSAVSVIEADKPLVLATGMDRYSDLCGVYLPAEDRWVAEPAWSHVVLLSDTLASGTSELGMGPTDLIDLADGSVLATAPEGGFALGAGFAYCRDMVCKEDGTLVADDYGPVIGAGSNLLVLGGAKSDLPTTILDRDGSVRAVESSGLQFYRMMGDYLVWTSDGGTCVTDADLNMIFSPGIFRDKNPDLNTAENIRPAACLDNGELFGIAFTDATGNTAYALTDAELHVTQVYDTGTIFMFPATDGGNDQCYVCTGQDDSLQITEVLSGTVIDLEETIQPEDIVSFLAINEQLYIQVQNSDLGEQMFVHTGDTWVTLSGRFRYGRKLTENTYELFSYSTPEQEGDTVYLLADGSIVGTRLADHMIYADGRFAAMFNENTLTVLNADGEVLLTFPIDSEAMDTWFSEAG